MDVPLSSSTLISTSLKALLRLAGLLCLVSVATFVLLSYSPIDPIKAYIGNDLLHVPPEQYARIAARWVWSNKIDLKQISLEAAFLELRSGSNNNKDLKYIHGDQNNHTKN